MSYKLMDFTTSKLNLPVLNTRVFQFDAGS